MKHKAKFLVGQVVYDTLYERYVVVYSTSYPYKSWIGYYVINSMPESRFRPLTRREQGKPRGAKEKRA